MGSLPTSQRSYSYTAASVVFALPDANASPTPSIPASVYTLTKTKFQYLPLRFPDSSTPG